MINEGSEEFDVCKGDESEGKSTTRESTDKEENQMKLSNNNESNGSCSGSKASSCKRSKCKEELSYDDGCQSFYSDSYVGYMDEILHIENYNPFSVMIYSIFF